MENQLFYGAKWIGMGNAYKSGCAILFRKKLKITQTVKNAEVLVSGLGIYELSLNGKKVGKAVLTPPQTNYEVRVGYDIYQVTEELKQENVITVLVGDGMYHQSQVWRSMKRPSDLNVATGFSYSCNENEDGSPIYGEPCLIFLLKVTLQNDEVIYCRSDETWKVDYSPIRENNLYLGETYDARFEVEGIYEPGFDDSNLKNAVLSKGPKGILVRNEMEPICETEEIKPVSFYKVTNGVYIYDMGINFAGYIKLCGTGYEGLKLQITYAESLKSETELQYGNYHQMIWHSKQEDCYIAGKEGYFSYKPRFTYHGFRYVKITGIYYPMELSDVIGIRVHTDLKLSGSFNCSNTYLNSYHLLCMNTIRSNIHGLPTDCPIRERCGWAGDAITSAETIMYNFDASRFLKKYIQDLIDSRVLFGEWKNVAPGRRGSGKACAAWGSAIAILPWEHYIFYGDAKILEMSYNWMVDWVNSLDDEAKGGLIYTGLDDHNKPPFYYDTPTVPQISSAYYYLSVRTVSLSAGVLGKKEDEEKYKSQAEYIKKRMMQEFYFHGSLGGPGIDALAICEGILPEEKILEVVANLKEQIIRFEYHFHVGHIGMNYMFQALSRHGETELLLRVLETKGCPGLRHMLDRGATTLWERWGGDADCLERYRGGSLNHPYKSGFDRWFYSDVLGICPEKPGFREVKIAPRCLKFIPHASGSYCSVSGKISVSYTTKQDSIRLCVQAEQGMKLKIRIGNIKVDRNGGESYEFELPKESTL